MTPLRLCTSLLVVMLASAALHAETYRFSPTAFYSTLSGDHPAALRIRSGDRVITRTLDDIGAGPDGTVVADGPMPHTGPFFVEGAEPGDLLVVTIGRLVPDRATGYSTSMMAPGSVPAGSLGSRPDKTRFAWKIDTASHVVRLDLEAVSASTDWKARFSSPAFELPLQPTIGSIGVAPAGPVPDAARPGPFGGNMTSSGVAAGARVMLPVFQPGALLYLGHGLARRGDGGVTGTGIETSLDVEFTVELIKKKEWPHSSVVRPSTVVGEFEQGWPRIETDDVLTTIGSGPTLEVALQQATLELHHWLDDDFGLSEKAVSIVVGQAIEYEVANIAGPDVTVAARIRKAYLPH